MSLVQRLQRNPLLLLGVGAALVIVAVILMVMNVSGRHRTENAASAALRKAAGDIQMQSIVVASRAIARGTMIASDDVMLRGVALPAPSDSFTAPTAVIGRVATADILPSQIILGEELSADKVAAGVSALLPEGQRAFSVRVTEDQIIGGFLRTNDRVDVFVTLPDSVFPRDTTVVKGEADQSRATLLLQNVVVLAVGDKLSTKGPDAINGVRTVSLAIAPEAVARLALADRLGKVSLAIRNPSDRTVAENTSVGLTDLGTMPEAETPVAEEKKAPAPTGHRITIYSGATTTTVTMP